MTGQGQCALGRQRDRGPIARFRRGSQENGRRPIDDQVIVDQTVRFRDHQGKLPAILVGEQDPAVVHIGRLDLVLVDDDIAGVAGGRETVLGGIQGGLEDLGRGTVIIDEDILALRIDLVDGSDPHILVGGLPDPDFQGVGGRSRIVLIVFCGRGRDGDGAFLAGCHPAAGIDRGDGLVAGGIGDGRVGPGKDRRLRRVAQEAGHGRRTEAEVAVRLPALQIEVHADGTSGAAELEDVGTGTGARLVVKELVFFAVVDFGRAEEEGPVGAGGQRIRIFYGRLVIDIDEARGAVAAVVADEIFAVVVLQVVLVPAVLDSERAGGDGTVGVGDDTTLGHDAQVRPVRSALEQPLVVRIDNQVGGAGGEGGGLGVLDGHRDGPDRRNPEHPVPGDGQVGRCLLDELIPVRIGHRDLETLREGRRREDHPELDGLVLRRAQLDRRLAEERDRRPGVRLHGHLRRGADGRPHIRFSGEALPVVAFEADGRNGYAFPVELQDEVTAYVLEFQ